MQREQMQYDVVIVGAGPAGLSAAIQLKQLDQRLSVCILEKGANVGAHILSGAVFEPRALNELLPNWSQLNAPLITKVSSDHFYYLTKKHAWRLPTPAPLCNHGNFIISLGQLCQWLAKQAETLGVEIYPGFTAVEALFSNNSVCGIVTGEMGVDKKQQATAQYQPGIELHTQQIILAEGCRGSLSQQLIQHFNLNKNCQAQNYGLGIKELWQIDPKQHTAGKVIHTVGWPLDRKTYAGSFIYHLKPDLLAVGLVVGLNYQNPYLDPFAEMQRFKTHPKFYCLFKNAQRISYGARSLIKGGIQALPTLSFPGGMLIGDTAGFLNAAKIKGIHTAMKSGIVAAETIVKAIQTKSVKTALNYKSALQKTWLWPELKKIRNIQPGFKYGLYLGLIHAAIDYYIFRGLAPWTLTNHADHNQLLDKTKAKKINYPRPDNEITFDKLSSVYLSNTSHKKNQPCHLHLHQTKLAIEINYTKYASPEQFYCPAAVYEIIKVNNQIKLQINPENCIHCKTCEIKDPTQNILWKAPESGSGPNYSQM